jgi:HSP20 family protein
MSIIRWDPFRDFISLRDEIDSLFDRFFTRERFISPLERSWTPSVDIYETKKEVVVRAELPGLSAKDVDITLTENTLTIKGEKKVSDEVKGENYYRVESAYGAFQRTIPLPVPVRNEKVKASFKDGVLEIRLPKVEEKAKGIKIKVEEK